MGIGKGSSKQVRVKKQVAKGTIADGATGGQIKRRNTANFNLVKDTYTTETEQTSTMQLTSSRHGPRQVNGRLNGILSPSTYADEFAALVRQAWAAVTQIDDVEITIAASGAFYTLTRTAGSWLTDGMKVGRVCRLAGAGLDADNANKNLLCIGVPSATVANVIPLNRRLPLVAEGPIAAVDVTFPGKLTSVPSTGHTDDYFTVEEWSPDVPRSQVSSDCKPTQAVLTLPGSGNVTVDFTWLGLDQTKDTSAYFAAPSAETTTEVMTASGGALVVGGVRKAVITDATLTIDGRGVVADPVVGDDVRPDVFSGKVMVSGSLTAYFDGGVESDLFIDETKTQLVFALAAGTEANADFMTLTMTNVKMNSADGDDPEVGSKRTYNFVAVRDKTGGAALATPLTTIEMQDSAVA